MGTQRKVLESKVAVPPWRNSKVSDIELEIARVKQGKVKRISISPSKRAVWAVFYGKPEFELRGTANFNSAIGANQKSAYYEKSKRKRPVLFILAGVHGQEFEGMMGALSVIRLMETGRDLQGNEQPKLLDKH